MTAADQEQGATGVLATWRGAPAAVKVLLFGVFVNRLGWFLQAFLVLFLTDRGFAEWQAATALGIFGAGTVVGLLVGGALSDRLGPRVAVLISMIGTAVFVVSILYLDYYPALVTVVALAGVVSQFYRPAAASLMTEFTPPNRQVMIYAMFRLALNLGTTASPLIAVALLSVSWELLFWGEAAAALAFAAIVAVALPRRQPAGAATPDDQPAAAAEAGPPVRTSYLAVLADYRYVVFLFCMFLNATIYVQYIATLPLAITDAGLSTWWYGAVLFINGFIVITCELAMTKVTQNWVPRTVAMVGFTLLGGGLAFYALPLGPAVLVIGTLIWTTAEIIGGPTMFAYPGMAAPAHLRGRYIGAAHGMFGLGLAVGPIAGVLVFGLVGNAVWLWCGAAGLVGVVAARYGMRLRPAGGDEAEAEATEPEPALSGASSTEAASLEDGR